MCGVAFASGDLPPPEQRDAAIASLAHRGPDRRRRHETEEVFLGHTRLSILDLSCAADQPMASPDGRYVLAYNGEIYNYIELGRHVERRGWQLRSRGDTEVLLALLVLEGSECVRWLRGMFAFVLWDSHQRTVLAARDPLGIKPLYYAHRRERTLIASELRTMRALGAPTTIDPHAVEDFLINGSVTAPRTMFSGVRALLPGCTLSVSEGKAVEQTYWRLSLSTPVIRSQDDVVDELDARLSEGIRQQLRADVPVGSFLSGGIDSSVISAYAAREISRPLLTFSIGFESRHSDWDETAYAKLVSERYATDHSRVVVTQPQFLAHMDNIVGSVDQPSVDGVNSYFISAAAASEVRVALSGQGGDELFAGYNIFQFARRLEALLDRLPRLPHKVQKLAMQFQRLPATLQYNWYGRAVMGYLSAGDPDLITAATKPLFGPAEIGAQLTASFSGPGAPRDLVNELSLRLIQGYLRNTLLRDMDAMSMAHSLEVRVPLVDHDLANFALSIPGDQKAAWGEAKRPLRALAKRMLPRELLERPKKQGFAFPMGEWLAHPTTLRRLNASLAPNAVREAGLVDERLVARELQRAQRSAGGEVHWLHAQRLWALFVLHEWAQTFGRGATGALTSVGVHERN